LKFVIFNADDFGYTRGVNRGIVEAHRQGVVTSASLIVNARATDEAVGLAAEMPDLSVGLHVNFTNEAQRLVELDDPVVARDELRRQFDRFVEMVGQKPTHLDSHQHVHRGAACGPAFQELAAEHGLPLRDNPPVVFKGGFYAQWEYGVSDPTKVGMEAIEAIIRNELTGGIYEMACHPGYFDEAMEMVYHRDRELELRTLCHPRLRAILREEGIRLIGYRQLSEAIKAIGWRPTTA
jgi:chitin disaccharide deacetylase